ncbi:MAG TPA: type II CAAX endopeptidase family protein [Thermoanaerobaculia bacterium]|nr:type II CAAX endopeptidase family protein [Thermoanaerobaculia bacterium]
MTPFTVPLIAIVLFWVALIYMNERYALFSVDHFSSTAIKWVAYVWLGVFLFLLTFLIVGSSMHPPTAKDLSRVPFYSLFTLHAILFTFLVGWWLLTRRPPLGAFLNVPREGAGEAVMTGFAVGVGGWILTILLALAIALILTATGVIPKNPQPSPMIGWMAALPLWKKGTIVLSAMIIEEAFFRGWLQKRVGLIISTTLFALAHSGLGQPLLLIGVAIISLIIGFTFYRTKNLIPGVIAHGIFDAVQLFVIIPVVFKMTGIGG